MKIADPITVATYAFAALLTATVALAAANATWHALGHFPDVRPDQRTPDFAKPAQPVDLRPILTLAPFGAPTSSDQPLQASSTNLVLRGVILASHPESSAAIIADAGGEPRPFSIGEAMPGGAVLDSVAADHVVLLLGGQRERLSFPDSQSSAGVAAIRATITGMPAGPAATAATAPGARPIAETIDVYRQKIADNPQTVLEEFSLKATAQGYLVGETIAPKVKRAGLEPGDLVVRVNGVPVGDIEKDRRLFEDVAASGRARVEVMRGDSLLILSFPLR